MPARPLLAAAHTLTSPSPYVRAWGRPGGPPPAGLHLFPGFFTAEQGATLARAALWKLDGLDGVRRRRRRGRASEGAGGAGGVEPSGAGGAELQELFEGEYGFEEGHFDAVIDGYREALMTTLPPDPALPPLLARLHALLPPALSPASPAPPASPDPPPPPTSPAFAAAGSTTHVLHLSPAGEIRAHIDHLDAMGSTIVGASLGAARVLRLERPAGRAGGEGAGPAGHGGWHGEGGGWDVLVPSGSVYVQTGDVRYSLAHSVLPYTHDASAWDGARLVPGHRISVMVRNAKA